MKKIIIYVALGILASTNALASKNNVYSFQFKQNSKNSFVITQKAATKEEAFKLAARECFKKLTNNQYPGEEKGLVIIDICANPKI